MPYLSPHLLASPLDAFLAQHLGTPSRGKVRDSYALPGYPEFMALRASDRLSVYDLVTSAQVPGKGAALTAQTIFWFRGPLSYLPHHLVAYGSGIDEYLPKALRGNKQIQSTMVIIRRLTMLSCEFVMRRCLTGSAIRSARKGESVCGYAFPVDIEDGHMLDAPIHTPTTKAAVGHDENIVFADAQVIFGEKAFQLAMAAFIAAQTHGDTCGITIADTKVELGYDSTGTLCIGDEVLTSDSSRLWPTALYHEARARREAPRGMDKEAARQATRLLETPFVDGDGKRIVGYHRLSPTNEHHQMFAAWNPLPHEVVVECASEYRKGVELVTGKSLEQFQAEVMGMAA